MRQAIDEQLLDEIRRYALRFTCADCAHFMGPLIGCAHAWPNEDHREIPDDSSVGNELVFCKEFDLV